MDTMTAFDEDWDDEDDRDEDAVGTA